MKVYVKFIEISMSSLDKENVVLMQRYIKDSSELA